MIKQTLVAVLFVFSTHAAVAETPQNVLSPPQTYCAARTLKMMPLATRPVFSVKAYGVAGDGQTDDTAGLQKALDQTPSGAVLVFPPGTYLHGKSLVLSKPGTVLLGQGGVLKATNPDDQALVLKGDKDAAIGLILQGTGVKRSSQPQTVKIKVAGRWNQVLNNKIEGGASAGIFVYGGKDFRIEGNDVRATLADGIHMTAGARRGLVRKNVVMNVGDDKIAVVSYTRQIERQDMGLSGDILIEKNAVGEGSWGRGITVVGGENVAVIDNAISDIPGVAGIMISQEKPSGTGGVRNVLVKNNKIERIEMPAKDDPRRYTGMGAIDVNSYNQYPLELIDIEGNEVTDSRFAGVRLLGDVCHVRIAGNRMKNVDFQHEGKRPIYVVNDPCAPQTISCADNLVEGKPYAPGKAVCGSEEETLSQDLSFLENNVWADCL